MKKEKTISALEFGSRKVKCAIGQITDDGNVELLGISAVETGGLMGGAIVHMELIIEAIAKAVDEASAAAGVKPDNFIVGIKGKSIESQLSMNSINISRTDKEILEEDRVRAIDAVKQLQISPDREIIETIIQSYSVDGQRGIADPVGLEGSHLGIHAHVVTCSTTALNNYQKAVNRAGFRVEQMAYAVLAAGNTVLTEEEKKLGVLLVDLGDQFSDAAVYGLGNSVMTRPFSIGGSIITASIAHVLKTTESTADEIKKKHAHAHTGHVKDAEEIQYYGTDGRTVRTAPKKTVTDIVNKCLDEDILIQINRLIDAGNIANRIKAGVVFTGGAAALKGLVEFSSHHLNQDVRIGYSTGVTGPEEVVNDPAQTALLGLLLSFRSKNVIKGPRFPNDRGPWEIIADFFRGWF